MKLLIEIPLFLLFFCFMSVDPVFNNFVIYRTCYITLRYNESDCALLGTSSADDYINHLEKLVQPQANILLMTKSILDSLLNVCLCLLLGPWSDTFGRKPVLLSAQIGYGIGGLLIAVVAAFPGLSPWWLIVSSFSVLFGGVGSFLSASTCYVTDTTTEENRGLRMGAYEGIMALGMLLGTIVSSYIFKAFGYTNMFFLIAAIIFLSVTFTVFAIPESVLNAETEGLFRGLFRTEHAKEMFKTVIKKRESYDRIVLHCLIAAMVIFILSINNETVVTMYLRGKFGWSLTHYTLYSSYSTVVWICGTIFSIFFLHKCLRIPESVLILVGFLSVMDQSLVYGLATKDWHIYFGGVTKLLGGSISPMIKSLISKVVSSDEIGKIFAFLSVMNVCMGMVSSILYTTVYNSTIHTYPGAFNFVSAGFYFISMLLTLVIVRFPRSTETYGPLLDLPEPSD